MGSETWLEVVWLPSFLTGARRILTEGDLIRIEAFLCDNPEARSITRRTGGFRRLRYGGPGHPIQNHGQDHRGCPTSGLPGVGDSAGAASSRPLPSRLCRPPGGQHRYRTGLGTGGSSALGHGQTIDQGGRTSPPGVPGGPHSGRLSPHRAECRIPTPLQSRSVLSTTNQSASRSELVSTTRWVTSRAGYRLFSSSRSTSSKTFTLL